jgi:late competence protein required for DNA uptake (superfamily II DNA/RNA helicase)
MCYLLAEVLLPGQAIQKVHASPKKLQFRKAIDVIMIDEVVAVSCETLCMCDTAFKFLTRDNISHSNLYQ